MMLVPTLTRVIGMTTRSRINFAFLKLSSIFNSIRSRINNLFVTLTSYAGAGIESQFVRKSASHINITIFIFTFSTAILLTYEVLNDKMHLRKRYAILLTTLITFISIYSAYNTWLSVLGSSGIIYNPCFQQAEIDKVKSKGLGYVHVLQAFCSQTGTPLLAQIDELAQNESQKSFLDMRQCLSKPQCIIYECINRIMDSDATQAAYITDLAKSRLLSNQCVSDKPIFRDPEGYKCLGSYRGLQDDIEYLPDNTMSLSFSYTRQGNKNPPSWCQQGYDLPVHSEVHGVDRDPEIDLKEFSYIKKYGNTQDMEWFKDNMLSNDDTNLIVDKYLFEKDINSDAYQIKSHADSFGDGVYKIGMIIPFTNGGIANKEGFDLQNAAELAAEEYKNNNIKIIFEDDKSTVSGAQAAAQKLISEGVKVIVGPLYNSNVLVVEKIAKRNGVPIIHFSDQESSLDEAGLYGAGLYGMSFSVKSYIEHMVEYAAENKARNVAIIVPVNKYGVSVIEEVEYQARRRKLIPEAAFQIDRETDIKDIGESIKRVSRPIDTVFVALRSTTAQEVIETLRGELGGGVNIIGVGDWDDKKITDRSALDRVKFVPWNGGEMADFAERYKARFGSRPDYVSSLAYDAVGVIANALPKKVNPDAKLSVESYINRSKGFVGVSGLFRFLGNGQIERGFTVDGFKDGNLVSLVPMPSGFPVD